MANSIIIEIILQLINWIAIQIRSKPRNDFTLYLVKVL